MNGGYIVSISNGNLEMKIILLSKNGKVQILSHLMAIIPYDSGISSSVLYITMLELK